MPRTPRGALPDGAFHVMTHAIDGQELFRCDVDRKLYLGLLQAVIERHDWTLVTFALMDNHVHLLVISTTEQLSAGLWRLNWKYAEYYKGRYRPRFGHVFGGRPKTKPIRTEAYFVAVVRYIALNPVGVACERPEQHRWSAHRAIVAVAPALPMLARDHLLAPFGANDAVSCYETFVTGSDPADHRAVRRWASGPPVGRPDLEALVADHTDASLRLAHEVWEYSISSIAGAVGLSRTAVRKAIARANEL